MFQINSERERERARQKRKTQTHRKYMLHEKRESVCVWDSRRDRETDINRESEWDVYIDIYYINIGTEKNDRANYREEKERKKKGIRYLYYLTSSMNRNAWKVHDSSTK